MSSDFSVEIKNFLSFNFQLIKSIFEFLMSKDLVRCEKTIDSFEKFFSMSRVFQISKLFESKMSYS